MVFGLVKRSVSNVVSTTSLEDYFWFWHQETKDNGPSSGWRHSQIKMFESYINPIIGKIPLSKIVPNHINKVIGKARTYRSPQTCSPIYNLLHKMFSDAIEEFELLTVNPVKKRHKPKIPTKESSHLSFEESMKLLLYSKTGLIKVRATYVRKEKRLKDYPKGGRWHTIKAPLELINYLRESKLASR